MLDANKGTASEAHARPLGTHEKSSALLPSITDAHAALEESLLLVRCRPGLTIWVERDRVYIECGDHGGSLNLLETFEAAERVLKLDSRDEGENFEVCFGGGL